MNKVYCYRCVIVIVDLARSVTRPLERMNSRAVPPGTGDVLGGDVLQKAEACAGEICNSVALWVSGAARLTFGG